MKNGRQWENFATLSSELLMDLSASFLDCWYEYQENLGLWYFRLDGFCWYQGRYCCADAIETYGLTFNEQLILSIQNAS